MSTETQRTTIYNVGEADFQQRVLERSRELPVVVDFWADWCGPCKQLTPVLERAATARAGKVELAKVDVDRNRGLQSAFHIQGIPAVKAFRDGSVAAEFTGALPPAQVESFFDSLVPSEADELARSGEEADLRRALELEPTHPEARRALGRLLLGRGETDEALGLLEGAPRRLPCRRPPGARRAHAGGGAARVARGCLRRVGPRRSRRGARGAPERLRDGGRPRPP